MLVPIPSLRPSVKEVLKASWLHLDDTQSSSSIINAVDTRQSSFENPPASVILKIHEDTENPKVTIRRLTEAERKAYDRESTHESDMTQNSNPRRRHRRNDRGNSYEGNDPVNISCVYSSPLLVFSYNTGIPESKKDQSLKSSRNQRSVIQPSQPAETHGEDEATYPSPLRYVPYREPAHKSRRRSSYIHHRPSESPQLAKQNQDNHSAYQSKYLAFNTLRSNSDKPLSDEVRAYLDKSMARNNQDALYTSVRPTTTSFESVSESTRSGPTQRAVQIRKKERALEREETEKERNRDWYPHTAPTQPSEKPGQSKSRHFPDTVPADHLILKTPRQVGPPYQYEQPRQQSLWSKTTDYLRNLSSQRPKNPASGTKPPTTPKSSAVKWKPASPVMRDDWTSTPGSSATKKQKGPVTPKSKHASALRGLR